MPLIVNLFAGPGAGKSTTAAGLFHELKRRHVKAELATEYAKDKFWEGALESMAKYPIYFFAKQHHRVARAAEHNDVVVCDSPFLLGLIYQGGSPELKALALAEHRRWPSLNVFLERGPEYPYSNTGRGQTEEEAAELDRRIKTMLIENGVFFFERQVATDLVVSLTNLIEWAGVELRNSNG